MERRLTIELAVLLGLAGLLAAAVVEAQHNRRGSGSAPDAPRSTRSVPGTVHQPSRYLLPPAGLGSAANAPPGFYRQLDAPPVTRRPRAVGRRTPVYLPVPYVVYVEPPELAVSPVQYEAPPPRDGAPRYVAPPPQAPPPPPIYIVQPSPVAAPPAPPAPRAPARPPAEPASREPVEVRFSIRPPDAAVHLDDEPLGSGAEVMARETAMRLAPGVHVLEVVHAEHPPQRLVFGISSADPIEVQIDLTAERVGRRSRIR